MEGPNVEFERKSSSCSHIYTHLRFLKQCGEGSTKDVFMLHNPNMQILVDITATFCSELMLIVDNMIGICVHQKILARV